jgi:hypothetical protein
MSAEVLLGCDVDPVLPTRLVERPGGDVWAVLDRVEELIERAGSRLPPVTWLIRADESVRFATGDYASGYLGRRAMWDRLVGAGHELGWHMHLLSRDATAGDFVFDPRPDWLEAAHGALAAHFPVLATRTGWDYASAFLFSELDRLGVRLDFSALPGNRVWHRVGRNRIVVDWLRCPAGPYRPDRGDHQRPGPSPLRLIELPLSQFRNSLAGMAKRFAWRLRHGCFSVRGLGNKTRLLTDRWDGLPVASRERWVCYFHPEDLSDDGIRNLLDNVGRLEATGATFLPASSIVAGCERDIALLP